MITLIVVAVVYVVAIGAFALLMRYDVSDNPYYGRADDDLDRRDRIRRAGGAKILEFKR